MAKSPIWMRWTSAAREIFLVAGLFALFAALTLPMFVSTESRAVRPRDGQIAIFPSLLAERPILLHGEWTIERLGRAGDVVMDQANVGITPHEPTHRQGMDDIDQPHLGE